MRALLVPTHGLSGGVPAPSPVSFASRKLCDGSPGSTSTRLGNRHEALLTRLRHACPADRSRCAAARFPLWHDAYAQLFEKMSSWMPGSPRSISIVPTGMD